MAAITVLKGNNVPHGPLSRAEVADQLNRGEITLDSLAFVEGLDQWTPLRDVLVKVDGVAPPVVSAPPVATMPIGTGYGTTGPVSVGAPAPVGTGYSYAVTMQPPEHLVYAGFWLRFAALFVDIIIILPVVAGSSVLSMIAQFTNDTTAKLLLSLVSLGYSLLCIVGQWLYFALQESSRHQATLGKRLLGIQVTDRAGNRVGFGRATGRYFGKMISGLILGIGYMMAGWTERKQALHDLMADTLVVRKPGA